MLETLFREQRRLANLVASTSGTPASGSSALAVVGGMGLPGRDGEDGSDFWIPPSPPAATPTIPNPQTVTIPISAAGLAVAGTGTFATPIAAVANQLIAIVSWGYQMQKNANSWTGGGGNLRLRYGATGTAAANTCPLGLNNTTAGSTGASAFGSSTGWGSLGTDLLNQAITLSCDSALGASGGVPAPVASGFVTIAYYLVG